MLSEEKIIEILMTQTMEIEAIDRLERTYGIQDGLEGFDENGKSILWLPLDEDSLDQYEYLIENKSLEASLLKWIKK